METAINETTEKTLASLPAETLESLWLSFETLNALEFAKYLHTLSGISDAVKREFLCAKVNQKPREQEDLMQKAVARAMDSFWSRLGAEKK
jgi:hypothetical protein